MHTKSVKASLSHEERTASEPRDAGLHPVILSKITPVNDQIKTYRFKIQDPKGISFLPGQWLDVHVPGIPKAGGFTITSAPQCALPPPEGSEDGERPYVELAVQKSPSNPPAAWLWQPANSILGQVLNVRVGGSFVWPPPDVPVECIKRAIFIAGGVGINPLMSMISHISQQNLSLEVRLLYSTKVPYGDLEIQKFLFLPRIVELARNRRLFLELFLTGSSDANRIEFGSMLIGGLMSGSDQKYPSPIKLRRQRIATEDLRVAAGDREMRATSVFYVCGPPEMTDGIVQQLHETDGIAPERVFCEKWW